MSLFPLRGGRRWNMARPGTQGELNAALGLSQISHSVLDKRR